MIQKAIDNFNLSSFAPEELIKDAWNEDNEDDESSESTQNLNLINLNNWTTSSLDQFRSKLLKDATSLLKKLYDQSHFKNLQKVIENINDAMMIYNKKKSLKDENL